MNELQIFNSEEFGEIRTVSVEGESRFCLVDVCRCLGIKNATDVCRRLDEDEVTRLNLGSKSGETNFVTESGLYAVILRSDKKKARTFRKWITSEVLPAIRKNGSYSIPHTTDGKIKLLAQGHTELSKKINDVDKDLQDFKRNLPLLPAEADNVKSHVSRKAIDILGGKESNAYKDSSIRGKVYSDIYNELKRQFGVTKYVYIKGNKLDEALSVVLNYVAPIILLEQIRDANAQMHL